jgi:transcriptional regulator with XRE-family HTH domain
MTIATDIQRRPAFTIGDRLRKARLMLGRDMDVQAFADLLGVSKNTVTNYELENTAPERMKPIVLRQWAMAAGVDFEWLLRGDEGSGGSGPGGVNLPSMDYKAEGSATKLGRIVHGNFGGVKAPEVEQLPNAA